MNRLQFQRLAKARLAESKVLLKAGHSSGAYYLAGYAVECALKAVIAKAVRRHDFPDRARVNRSWQHKLSDLVDMAGLESSRIELISRDAIFSVNWNLVVPWSEEARYSEWDQMAAKALVEAIAQKQYGVMSWLTQHW